MFPLPNYSLEKNINSAEELLNAFFTYEESQIVSKFIKESIEYAEKIDKEKVSVSFRKDKKIIRVNVGRLEVVSLSRNGLLIVLDYSSLLDELKEVLDNNWQYPEDRPTAYSNLEHSCRIRLNPYNLKNFYSIFRKGNDLLIRKAIDTGKNVWLNADSKTTRDTLRNFSDGTQSVPELQSPNKYLFDFKGKLLCEIDEFFRKISQVVLPTEDENKKALIELQNLKNKEYEKKVLDIAHKNLRLFRSKLVPYLADNDTSKKELKLVAESLIEGLLTSIKNFEPKLEYKLSTYAEFSLRQRKTRATAKIIQGRIDKEFNTIIGIGIIEKAFYDYKKVHGEYPGYDSWIEYLKPTIKERVNIEKNRKDKKEALHQKRLGINKLYKKLSETDDMPEDADSLLEDVEEAMSRLDEQEVDILNSRYGILDSSNEYGETLESVGERYALTRERIRQIENIAMDKLRFILSNKDGENGLIPKHLLKNKSLDFLKEINIKYIHQLIKLSTQEITHIHKQSKLVVDDLTQIVRLCGFELNTQNEGYINLDTLSNRTKNVFIQNNLLKIENLLNISEESYQYFTGIGEKSILEIKELVNELKIDKNFNPIGKEDEEKIGVEVYSDESLLSRLKIDISEDLADELLMGDVESVARVIKAIEKELYN